MIPAAVFLSAIFGASYGSGREVMEFVSSLGPTGGLVSLSTVALTHCVLLALSFELARLFKAYDYVSFCRALLGPGWVLYEIVILMGLLIALSITLTVGGTVLEDHFGIAVWMGSVLIFVLVVALNYFGRSLVERSMMVSVLALFAVLAVLAMQLTALTDEVIGKFANEAHQPGGIPAGLKYAIGGGGYIPLLLYCAMGLKSRAEAFTAGLTAAAIAVVPATVFHLAFMVGYPDVVSERIPAYWMFNQISSPLMLNIYVLVMFVLVAQTGVALMHGFVMRIDNWHHKRKNRPISQVGHAAISASVLLISLTLGTMGIVALILRGYTIMFFSFIVVFVLPLVTYGAYLVFRRNSRNG